MNTFLKLFFNSFLRVFKGTEHFLFNPCASVEDGREMKRAL